MPNQTSYILFLIAGLLSFNCFAENRSTLKQAIDVSQSKLESSAQTQEQINDLDDSTQKLLSEYSATLQQLETYRQYNNQLQRLLDSQQKELNALNQQLNSIDATKRDIFPFLERLISGLEQFVSIDLPFLPEERHARIKRLKNNLDRSDISLAEKLRQIFEAYRIELDYGRNIEAYQASLVLNDKPQTLHFLRIGRIGLYYLSLDESHCGFWNPESKSWEALSTDYIHSIHEGINIALKKLPPNLLRLPLTTPEKKS